MNQNQDLDRPNVVLIMADDMGFSDIRPYGERSPHRTSSDLPVRVSVSARCTTLPAAVLLEPHYSQGSIHIRQVWAI